MTIAMLALAGIPATAGFIGKFYLIDAAVDGGYTWLGVVIVVGSMISLAYYLRVVAAMWMRPAARAVPVLAGGSSELTPEDAPHGPRPAGWEITAIAVLAAAATVVIGIAPNWLFDLAHDVASSMSQLF